MDKVVSRICLLDLMMKSGYFQMKKRLSFEVQKAEVGLSAHPLPSTASVREGEFGRASASRLHAKRKISALSVACVFSQAQRKTDAKPKPTYSR